MVDNLKVGDFLENYNLLKDVIDSCDIYINKELISQENVIEIEKEFLAESFESEKHSKSIFLHTGSLCYDAVVLVLSVLVDIIYDDIDIDDYIDSFEIGMRVEYKGNHYKYIGSENELYVLEEMKANVSGVRKIPKKQFNKVIPYYGNAKKGNMQGIKKDQSRRREFLKDIVGKTENEIIAIPRTSIVMYMDESKLDYLLENIVLEFPNKRKFKLLELVTVSYYTDNNEKRKRGNPHNNDPAIKVTSSMEKARELVIEKSDNRVIGFISLKNDCYKRYASDFENLFNRRKLMFSWLCVKIEKDSWLEMIIENHGDKINILSYTKRFLNKYNVDNIENNNICKTLSEEVLIAKQRTVEEIVVDGGVKWEDYKKIKIKIKFILDNGTSEEAKIFSRWAYYMLKLFNNAYLKLDSEVIENSIIEYKEKILKFESLVKKSAEDVIEYIADTYLNFKEDNLKGEKIKSDIIRGLYKNVLFVTQPGRNISEFKDFLRSTQANKYSVITESNVKNHSAIKQSCVVFMSLMNYDNVNPFDYISSRKTLIYVYDSQVKLLHKVKKDYQKYINELDMANPYEIVIDDIQDAQNAEEEELGFLEEKQNEEIQNILMKDFIITEQYRAKHYFDSKKNNNNNGLEAFRYGYFLSGENIIFTKGYIAYVLDEEKEAVVEKKVDDLEVGDQILFTSNDNETKDIVEELLLDIVKRDISTKQNYEKVKYWKNKLESFRNDNELTYEELKIMFAKEGKKIAAQTIRQWLDRQSHILGPDIEETYLVIGKVVGDEEIVNRYIEYFNATATIRSIRRELLKVIKQVVVADMNGIDYSGGGLFHESINKIRNIAEIKVLNKIDTIDKFIVPANRANRPLDN